MSDPRIERARSLLQEMADRYVSADLPNYIDELEKALYNLEDMPSDEVCQNFIRRAHTLKGAAGCYGFRAITNICAEIEDRAVTLWAADEAPSVISDSIQPYIRLLRETRHLIVTDQEQQLSRVSDELIELRGRTRKSCLIVDRSPMIRDACQAAAEGLGVECVAITEGHDAVGLLLERRFDLLITGIDTGPISGISLVALARGSRTRWHDLRTMLIASNLADLDPGELGPDVVIPMSRQMDTVLKDALQDLLSRRPSDARSLAA